MDKIYSHISSIFSEINRAKNQSNIPVKHTVNKYTKTERKKNKSYN